MLKFQGQREFKDILIKAKELGYEFYEQNFQRRFKNDKYDICLRSFGKFFVYDKEGNCVASERSKDLDNEKWYRDILKMFYIPVK